jgi:phosphatidylserine decarboxylase
MLYLFQLLFISLILLILFKLWFQRKPQLYLSKYYAQSNILISPAYGTVEKIYHNQEKKTYVIAVYLGPFDIHTQYYPTMGEVLEMTYDLNGRYELAFDLNKSRFNEKYITVIRDVQWNKIKIIQIAGMFARRIETQYRVGESVSIGDELGHINLGSRVDIEFPDKYTILIHEGQYVSPNIIIAERPM